MVIRPLFAFMLTIAVLFASAMTGTAAASAATMNHDIQMMEMGHCSSAPSNHEDKSTPKQCCIAMCLAVAVAPSAPPDLPMVQQAVPTFTIPTEHDAYLGEIATPPPRRA